MICQHCGAENEEKPAKARRSAPQHKRMFALFRAAHLHWSERHHEFQPRNEGHLRYWLEMKAGHFDVVLHKRVASMPAARLAAIITTVLEFGRDDCLFVESDAEFLTVKRVKSISYADLPHKDACKLFEAIEEVLAAEGLEPDQILKETERAA